MNVAFVIDGFEFTSKTEESMIKFCLRNMQQKRFMNHSAVKKMKKSQRVGDIYECPHCYQKVYRLTAAHVGSNAAQMIDIIMKNNPGATLCSLNAMVLKKDCETKIAIACDKCNKVFETCQ